MLKIHSFISFGILILTFAAAQQAHSHHAAAGFYEPDLRASVSGTVQSLVWRNPHVRFELLVTNEQGAEEVWDIETGSLNTLERMNVTREMLEPGTFLTASGDPGRNGRTIMFADEIVSADGEASATNPPATVRYRIGDRAEADDIYRVWVPFIRPDTGRVDQSYPLTDAGRAAFTTWDPADDPALRCIPPGMPVAMDNPYPVSFEDLGDRIIFRLEEWDGVRTIYMSADAAAETPEPSPMGYSIGRWENSTTLVVETSGISYPYLDDVGTPQSAASRMTERFTLQQEAGLLLWSAVVEDPEYFSEPVLYEIAWEYIPGNVMKEFNCAVSE